MRAKRGELQAIFRHLRRRSPQACTPRLWRGSTSSGPPRRWPRSVPQSGESSLTPCFFSVASKPEPELASALDRLISAGLLFRQGVPPYSSYLFKHALVQDAAYGTLLRRRRQELHARVATALEQHFADLVDRQPEILAHHLTGAGQAERASDQWLKAGQFAASRSAYAEAVSHFDRGLSLLPSLLDAQRDRQEIKLQLAKGVSLSNANGFSSAEAAKAHARAHELSDKIGDIDSQFTAIWGLWTFRRTSDWNAARQLSDRLRAWSKRVIMSAFGSKLIIRVGQHISSVANSLRRRSIARRAEPFMSSSSTGRTHTSTATTLESVHER